MLDRKSFYDRVRADVFGGKLTAPQVVGTNSILDAWEASHAALDPRWLADALGTTFHETAGTMRPIEEYGRGAGRPYGVPDPETGQTYYGRGYVQLTWKRNYLAMSAVVGADLVRHPELALRTDYASRIMFHGMIYGSFTGKKLSDYFDGPKEDWVNARRIINGTDCAEKIAGYGQAFHRAIKEATR